MLRIFATLALALFLAAFLPEWSGGISGDGGSSMAHATGSGSGGGHGGGDGGDSGDGGFGGLGGEGNSGANGGGEGGGADCQGHQCGNITGQSGGSRPKGSIGLEAIKAFLSGLFD